MTKYRQVAFLPKSTIRACLDFDFWKSGFCFLENGLGKQKKTAAASDYPCSQPAAAVYLMSAICFYFSPLNSKMRSWSSVPVELLS